MAVICVIRAGFRELSCWQKSVQVSSCMLVRDLLIVLEFVGIVVVESSYTNVSTGWANFYHKDEQGHRDVSKWRKKTPRYITSLSIRNEQLYYRMCTIENP